MTDFSETDLVDSIQAPDRVVYLSNSAKLGLEYNALQIMNVLTIILLIVYTAVLLNTVYTHEGLKFTDVPYYITTVSSDTQTSRFASLDYYVLWSDILYWLLPIISLYTVIAIMIQGWRVQWLYIIVTGLLFILAAAKFVYLAISFLACNRMANCTNEDGGGPRGNASTLFVWRFVTSFLFFVITFVYLILGKPIGSLEKERTLMSKKIT